MQATLRPWLAAFLLTWPTAARANTLADAANTAATQLVQSMKEAGVGPEDTVTVLPLDGDVGGELGSALQAAFKKMGGPRVIDKKALRAAFEEAALGVPMDEDAMMEMTAAMGARALITGSVVTKADSKSANIRVVSIGEGTVLATGSVSWTGSGEAPSTEAQTLDSRLRRLADRVAQGLEALEGEARYQRFAVLEFEEIGASTEEKELGLLISSELTTLLQRDHGLMIVERAQLAKVLEELALGQTGLTDPSTVSEVGKLAGAQGLILGTVAEAGDRYKVTTRVAAAGTGEIVVAETTELPAGDLVALSSEAVVLRTRTGALYRSLLLPGWGQLYNRQPIKGGAFVVAEVGAAVTAVVFHFRGASFERKYEDAQDPSANFERKIERAEDSYRYRNIFIYVALGVHLINIADAFFSGKSFETAAVGSSPALGFSW